MPRLNNLDNRLRAGWKQRFLALHRICSVVCHVKRIRRAIFRCAFISSLREVFSWQTRFRWFGPSFLE